LNYLKQLAGQTAIYGLGTIVPRLLNFLLMTPFYTRVFVKGEYGVISELYTYSALLIVLLTYGMETTFFRFSEKKENKESVFSTSLIAVSFPALLFILLVVLFAAPIAGIIQYSANVEYVVYFALIIGMEAIIAIPFARLRQQNKAFRFTIIKLINVGLQIGLNLFFLWICPLLIQQNPDSIGK